MTDNARVARVFNDNALVDAAVRKGVEEAIERHRRMGTKIAIWHDGKPLVVTVEEAEALERSAAAPQKAG